MSPSASAPTPTTPFGASADLPKPPGLTWRVQSREPVGYDVHIVRGLLDPANPMLARACGADGQNPTRCLVVVDDKVRTLYGERVRAYLDAWRVESFWKVLPGDEAAKELTSAVEVTEAMTAMGLLRRTEKVVAIGGGVVLDVAGFAASLYRRGVPYVRVPTTLLGQIDAGIGVKTGVNHGTHKNRLRTYYAPETALIGPGLLATVDPRHIVNGMAEIIKMALVKDRTLFDLLEAVVAGAGLVARPRPRLVVRQVGLADLEHVAAGRHLAVMQPDRLPAQLLHVVHAVRDQQQGAAAGQAQPAGKDAAGAAPRKAPGMQEARRG